MSNQSRPSWSPPSNSVLKLHVSDEPYRIINLEELLDNQGHVSYKELVRLCIKYSRDSGRKKKRISDLDAEKEQWEVNLSCYDEDGDRVGLYSDAELLEAFRQAEKKRPIGLGGVALFAKNWSSVAGFQNQLVLNCFALVTKKKEAKGAKIPRGYIPTGLRAKRNSALDGTARAVKTWTASPSRRGGRVGPNVHRQLQNLLESFVCILARAMLVLQEHLEGARANANMLDELEGGRFKTCRTVKGGRAENRTNMECAGKMSVINNLDEKAQDVQLEEIAYAVENVHPKVDEQLPHEKSTGSVTEGNSNAGDIPVKEIMPKCSQSIQSDQMSEVPLFKPKQDNHGEDEEMKQIEDSKHADDPWTAAKRGDLSAIKSFSLSPTMDWTKEDAFESTPLYYACHSGAAIGKDGLNTVQLLLELWPGTIPHKVLERCKKNAINPDVVELIERASSTSPSQEGKLGAGRTEGKGAMKLVTATPTKIAADDLMDEEKQTNDAVTKGPDSKEGGKEVEGKKGDKVSESVTDGLVPSTMGKNAMVAPVSTFDRNFIHGRHTCDGCLKQPIVGIRYRATNIADYDLCEDCMGKVTESEIEFEPEQLEQDRVFQTRASRKARRTVRPVRHRHASKYRPTLLEQARGLRQWKSQRETTGKKIQKEKVGETIQKQEVDVKQTIRRTFIELITAGPPAGEYESKPKTEEKKKQDHKLTTKAPSDKKATDTQKEQVGKTRKEVKAAIFRSLIEIMTAGPPEVEAESKADVIPKLVEKDEVSVGMPVATATASALVAMKIETATMANPAEDQKIDEKSVATLEDEQKTAASPESNESDTESPAETGSERNVLNHVNVDALENCVLTVGGFVHGVVEGSIVAGRQASVSASVAAVESKKHAVAVAISVTSVARRAATVAAESKKRAAAYAETIQRAAAEAESKKHAAAFVDETNNATVTVSKGVDSTTKSEKSEAKEAEACEEMTVEDCDKNAKSTDGTVGEDDIETKTIEHEVREDDIVETTDFTTEETASASEKASVESADGKILVPATNNTSDENQTEEISIVTPVLDEEDEASSSISLSICSSNMGVLQKECAKDEANAVPPNENEQIEIALSEGAIIVDSGNDNPTAVPIDGKDDNDWDVIFVANNDSNDSESVDTRKSEGLARATVMIGTALFNEDVSRSAEEFVTDDSRATVMIGTALFNEDVSRSAEVLCADDNIVVLTKPKDTDVIVPSEDERSVTDERRGSSSSISFVKSLSSASLASSMSMVSAVSSDSSSCMSMVSSVSVISIDSSAVDTAKSEDDFEVLGDDESLSLV